MTERGRDMDSNTVPISTEQDSREQEMCAAVKQAYKSGATREEIAFWVQAALDEETKGSH